jgi:hypothetical protein
MRERPAGSWAVGWKREGEREGWGLGVFSFFFKPLDFKLSKLKHLQNSFQNFFPTFKL